MTSDSVEVRAAPRNKSARADALVPQVESADRRAIAGVLGWGALIAVAIAWGRNAVVHRGIGLDAAPLAGYWRDPKWLGLVPAGVLAFAALVWAPRLASAWSFRRVVAGASVLAVSWTVLLAGSDGLARIAGPLDNKIEYLPFSHRIGDPLLFLRTFVERVPRYPTHVKSHPPGVPLLYWALDRVGLGSPVFGACLVIGAWGVAVGAVLITCREVAGDRRARQAAPFVALVPAAIWAGTSSDALFAGVGAIAVAGMVVAVVRRRSMLAAISGVVLGAALLLSYSLVLLLVIPLLVAARERRSRELIVGAAATIGIVALPLLAGFWWLDGLGATRAAYWHGFASHRPGGYLTLVGNPAALACAIGPATVAGLASLRRHRDGALLLLVGGAAIGVLAGDLSQLSRGEVERIWLPFVPWLAVAAAAAPERVWLALQLAVGLALQAILWTAW